MRKAFTMIELVFVIAVVGILASIAVPRLAATRDDAEIAAAASTIASVKSAIATERQLRTLRGDFTVITSANADGGAFSTFSADGAGNKNRVLEGTVALCNTGTTKGCWASGTQYLMPTDGAAVDFTWTNGRFDCSATDNNCKLLTQ